MCKSWVVPSQYICICRIWVAACMQRRCCSSVYVRASTCQWLHCYCLAFWLCVSSTHEYSAVTALLMLMRLFSSSDKHSLQKIRSQHLVQINLVVNLCVYEQRLCHVFAVYVIAMHVNRFDKAKNWLIYCITWACRYAKAESCLRNMCVCDVYELQRMRKDVAVILCI